MKLSFVMALDHRNREVWRHYRASVEWLGPGHPETQRIRASVRAMLENYTATKARLDERRAVLGLA